jgi:hypothetical protein
MPSYQQLLEGLEAISAAERRFTGLETEDAAESLLGVFAAQQPTLEKADGLNDQHKQVRDRLIQDGESFRAALTTARGITDKGDSRWHLRRDYGHRLGALARDLIGLLEAGGIE